MSKKDTLHYEALKAPLAKSLPRRGRPSVVRWNALYGLRAIDARGSNLPGHTLFIFAKVPGMTHLTKLFGQSFRGPCLRDPNLSSLASKAVEKLIA